MGITNYLQTLDDAEIRAYFMEKEEGKALDFKMKLNLETGDDIKEFLADVSAFANTEGGMLVYGAKETKGVCYEVEGFDINDQDALLQKIENLLRDCIEPNIPYKTIVIKKLSNNKNVLIIEILQSFSKPHAVNYRGHWRVFARNHAGKFPLDIYDLKSMILSSNEMLQGLHKFRLQRISSILANDLPLSFENPEDPKLVVHVFPQNAFYKATAIDLVEVSNWKDLISPIGSDYSTERFNFDGLISICTPNRNDLMTKYFQLYRSGVIETVNGLILHVNPNGIRLDIICTKIKAFLSQVIKLYSRLQIHPPIYFCISLLQTKDKYASRNPAYFDDFLSRKFDRSSLILPEIVINDFSAELNTLLKDSFGIIWNSVGFSKPYLD